MLLVTEKDSRDGFIIIIIGILAVSIIIISSIWLFVCDYYWTRKRYPPFFRFTRSNFIIAITCIGVNLSRIQQLEAVEKQKLIKKYIQRVFHDEYGIGDNLISAKQDPVSNKSICIWLNKHLEKFDRLNFVLFCVQLVSIDGFITATEQKEIDEIANYLKIPKIEYQGYIEGVNQKHFDKDRINSKPNNQKKPINSALLFFGFKTLPTFIQLKSEFRKRVKACHPDLFPGISSEKRKELEVEFHLLQKNYTELLLLIEE